MSMDGPEGRFQHFLKRYRFDLDADVSQSKCSSGDPQAKLWSETSTVHRVGLVTLEDLLETGLPVHVPVTIFSDLHDHPDATLHALLQRQHDEMAFFDPTRYRSMIADNKCIMLVDLAFAAYYGAFDAGGEQSAVAPSSAPA